MRARLYFIIASAALLALLPFIFKFFLTALNSKRFQKWETPISFYGQVVDQFGVPIQGAKVEFRWNDISPTGTSEEKTASDDRGYFSLLNKTGKILQIDLSKDGYHTPKSSRVRSFDYADAYESNYHLPDRNHPVVFSLRKKGPGALLITGKADIPLRTDGTPVRLNLLGGGSIDQGGQVEIAVVSDPSAKPPLPFDWKISLSVIDGGLIEQTDEFGFTPPTEGYTQSEATHFLASDKHWKRVFRKKYYLRFGNPAQYARLTVGLEAGRPLAMISFAINPSGEPDLEPAAKKR